MAATERKKKVGIGFISESDRYLFGQGTHYEIYRKLGAHPAVYRKKEGVYFAVWAPHAKAVSVVGDFNDWNPKAHPMKVLATSGIYEKFISGLKPGALYKFAVTGQDGKTELKADPYAQSAEFRPGTASKVVANSTFKWTDASWLEARAGKNQRQEAVSIYEVHLGSWKRKDREEKEGFYTYKEAARELGDYVKKMGYTHVELMGIAEHPLDASWGYQVTGYYAPTSRYGTPEEFRYMINYLHKKGIGVILDWVPAHFPRDAYGLANFDGEPLYEYADTRKGEHPDWGTKVFDYAKNEVKNFLIANALYWIEEFHVDGLRVDAVASMLYLDYGRKDGQWVANEYGGNQNLEAIEFFRHLNSIISKRNAGVMMIAEESTAWPLLTHDPAVGGLGFTFKWNMGWMHDFLEYMKLDPYFRKFNHNKLTFALTYFNSENFILVLSHDEVVHLKCSMINKMPGYFSDKIANLKAAYTYMIGHPGKKLLFMGQEFGQLHEWDEKVSLDWQLTQEPLHAELQKYYADLLHVYKKYPALWQMDDDWDGFQWINANDGDRSIFSFIRYARDKKNSMVFVVNFTPVERPDYRVGVPKAGTYRVVLDSAHGLYKTSEKPYAAKAVEQECDGQPFSIPLPLPAYGAVILKFS